MLADSQCVLCGKQFHSNREAFLCNTCEKQEKYTDVQIQFKNNHNKDFPCPTCTFRNPSDSIQCEVCHHIFEQKLNNIPPSKVEIKELVTCEKCKFENHIINEYCLNCEEELFEHVKKACDICGLKVKEDNFKKHYEDCKLSLSMIQKEQEDKRFKDMKEPFDIPYQEPFFIPDEQPYGDEIKPFHQLKPIVVKPIVKIPQKQKKPLNKPIKLQKPQGLFKDVVGYLNFVNQSPTMSCYYCYKKIQKLQFSYHTQNCQKKDEWQKSMQPANSRMTPLQVKTVLYMHNKSMKEHEGVRRQLQQKIQKLGYSSNDLENLSFYIENYAPIIIQIHISKHMEFFVKDTHYRNQFETNKSSGSLSRPSRTQWEDRMFDKNYNKATDYERVKYGVINFTNDPKGVQSAISYGPSYFLLKSHVRDRCTFTDKDSSGADASIATLKFGFKIISKMNDNELKAAFSASKALEMSSKVIVTYKELQIHGPIEFSKDIERVYVNKSEINGNKKLLDLVYEFSQKFKVQHDFI